MTDPSSFQTNRDLFSNHYLTDTLRDREPWNEVSDEEVREAYEEISDLVDSKLDRVEDYNEAQLERNLIRPIFDILGIPFEIEETVERNARRPDYGFFPSDEAADAAFDREDFYEESIAVADAKRWGRKLDTRGEEKRDFENPSYQIHRYLQETPTQWAVLTNGAQWRLYYEPTSHRLDSYYEIDLPAILDTVAEEGGIESFKYFYLFFRKEAFLPDQTGDCFLDDVYSESNVFAEELGEDLQENIYEAIRVLAEGFIETNEELDEADLDLIHDSSLIYLYRLIFVLYAESEGRNLLPTNNEIYSSSYSLNELKLEVVEKRDETKQHYQAWQTDLWDQLDELFVLIDNGSKGKGIPEDDLYIPAYNGGLFRTSPDEDDTDESQFLSNHEVGDAYIAEVIELLTRHEASEGDGKVFVDYSSLDERNLGSIYEGLLEYQLDVASEPLTVDDGEYTSAGEGDDVTVDEGEVYLRTDDGERKATGSYYTPEYIVEHIVDETLEPLVDDIREDMLAESTYSEEQGFADEFADRVFDVSVLDPAMGSGHFLVNAVDYLAREIIDAQEKQDRQALESAEAQISSPTTEDGELRDINWARRKVAQRCIYGVDINPLAVELAKVSLWLRTLAAEQPLAFLDHHLKTGNSLVGSDIGEILDNGANTNSNDGQLTLEESFAHTRKQALGYVMERFQELLNIDNETLSDIKEMEKTYENVRQDDLYKNLISIANVHTAVGYGIDVPENVYKRMATALRDDSWEDIENQDWFKTAQSIANNKNFFHWELEFPVAFYDKNGVRKNDAGFDAVIGNPPYVLINRESQTGSYYEETFSTASGYKPDLYMPFIEQSAELAKNNADIGLIVPNRFFLTKSGSNIRDYLSNCNIKKIVDFGQSRVFGDALNYVCILSFSPLSDDTAFKYIASDAGMKETQSQELAVELIEGDSWSFPDPDLMGIIKNINKNSVPFGNIFNDMFAGAQTGADDILLRDQPFDGEEDIFVPFLRSKDIRQYRTNRDSEYVIFPYDDNGEIIEETRLSNEYPDTYEYLKTHQDGLEDRIWHDQGPIERSGEWYGLMYMPSAEKFIKNKIVCPYLASNTVFTYDTDESIFGTGAGYGITIEGDEQRQKSFVCLLNSTMVNVLFTQVSPEFQSGYKFNKEYIKQIPIPEIVENSFKIPIEEVTENGSETRNRSEETVGELFSTLYDNIREAQISRNSLNLSLTDYLGNYSEGQTLADLGLFQPASSTILDKTSIHYEKLQIENVETFRDGNSVVIRATARYKPENEEAFETDRWGYTETDYFEAFTLNGLSNHEADLVEAFVPVAVNKEIGGFRDNATKNKSLTERLKEIIMPDLDDVKDDLERFAQTKERENELDETISQTNQIINEVVYGLYGLSKNEIEQVEKTAEK